MAIAVYVLCALTSSLCAFMLFRKYKKMPVPLLLWSSICFMFLALDNILLFVDMVVLPPEIDISIYRTIPSVIGVCALLYGFVWDQS